MSALIKDILTFSHISIGRETETPVGLTQIISQVCADPDDVIKESDAQITIKTLPEVLGNASQLGQLFQNLLSNALKFKQPHVQSLIEIRSQIVFAEKLPQTVRPTKLVSSYHCVDVVDNGIGFDEIYLDRIFQVFQRLHGQNTFSGTGIGLAICEKVAANHGGAITARSEPGEGTTFSVYLPV